MTRPTYYVACQDCHEYITLGEWGHVYDTQSTHAFFQTHDGHQYTHTTAPRNTWTHWQDQHGPCVNCNATPDQYAEPPERRWGIAVCPDCWTELIEEPGGTARLKQRLRRLDNNTP